MIAESSAMATEPSAMTTESSAMAAETSAMATEPSATAAESSAMSKKARKSSKNYFLTIKSIKMATKKSFLPKGDTGLVPWLQTFSSKIGGYATKYNLLPAEVTKVQNGILFLLYWIQAVADTKNKGQNVTAYKNEVRDGVKAGGSPSVPPTDLLFTPPPSVDPGIVPFILSIAGRIKKHQGYTIADGEQMGIEGAEEVLDQLNMKPTFRIEMQSGRPNLVWTKGSASAVKIKVMRIANTVTPPPVPPTPGDFTDFDFLAIDTQPDYLDTAALPPFGQSATWIYVMIYMIGDEEVGQWSDPAIATVGGAF